MRQIIFPIGKYTRERAERILTRIIRNRGISMVGGNALFDLRDQGRLSRKERQSDGSFLAIHGPMPIKGFIAFVR